MSVIDQAKITDYDKDMVDYTQVSFEPDLKRFGMKTLTNDMLQVFKKRVYDLAGCSPKTVSIYLNNKKVSCIKSFEDYINLYFRSSTKDSADQIKIYEKVNNRWEVCVSLSTTGSL